MKKLCLKLAMMAVALTIITGCKENVSSKTSKVDKNAEVTIYLTRHGKTMLNTTDRSQGWIDAPLTPAGVEIPEYLGKGLKAEKVTFDAVYSSDSGRAVETANIALKNSGQEDLLKNLKTDKRLREVNFGTYEGMPNEEMWTAIADKQGKTLDAFQAGMAKDGFVNTIKGFADTLHELDKAKLEELAQKNKVPAADVSWQAEDYQTVIARSKSALDDIVKDAQKNGQKNILVTSHGMTIAALVSSLDEKAPVPATGLKNASVSKITYKDGQYKVATVNDLTYVEKDK
ncbi:histidine phosphatase family protein [Lactococcus laudensis]|uniref:histidine phosphatase family protein n=1 Tax=Pseudolactococcus laudensis TaxID=1494461 RepID=UPI0002774CB8|nr:Phosphoglycerate mutase family [Lactococcus raffinolactis 4877]